MNLFSNFLGYTLVLLLTFFVGRGVIRIYIDSILPKRQRKKLAKNQSFVEWFSYGRYLDVLPKSKLVGYYSNFVIYVALLIIATILNHLDMKEISAYLIWVYFVFEVLVINFLRF